MDSEDDEILYNAVSEYEASVNRENNQQPSAGQYIIYLYKSYRLCVYISNVSGRACLSACLYISNALGHVCVSSSNVSGHACWSVYLQ